MCRKLSCLSLEVCQYDLDSNSDPHTHWQDTRGNHDSSLVGERAVMFLVRVNQQHAVPLRSLNSNLFLEQMRVLNSHLFLDQMKVLVYCRFKSNATLQSNTVSVTALRGILVHPSPQNM